MAESASGLFGDGLDFLKSSLKGTANTAIGLGGALLTGQQNLTAYSGALAENTKAFGQLGGAVGKVVDGLAKFAESSLAEYQALTGIGATFSKEMKDIKIAAAEFGMSVEDMTTFLKENSQALKTFGGTTDMAIARFRALSNAVLDSEKLNIELRRLGFTTKDINEGLALFGEITRGNANVEKMSVQEQAQSARDLMVQLDGLAKLTGKNRKELADEMRARRRQGDVNAFLMGKNAEESKAFMDQLTEMQATLGQDAADAFVDIALRGAPTTEGARNAMLAMGSGADQLYDAAAQFNSGDIGAFTESMRAARGAALDYQDTEEFRNTAILGGVTGVSESFAKASGAAMDFKNAIDSTREDGTTSAQAEGELRRQILEQQLTQMESNQGVLDETINIQTNLRKVSTEVMKATIGEIEDVAIAGLQKLTAAMPTSTEIANGLSKGVNALFNIAQLEDAKNTNESNMGINNGYLRDIFEALGYQTEETTEAINESTKTTSETLNETSSTTQSVVKETEEKVLTAQQQLEKAQADIAKLTSDGFTAMDPPVRAAQEAAEKAAKGIEILARAQEHTMNKIAQFQNNRGRFTGGFAEGGSIPRGGYGLVGEAGPEFVSGPANVMSARTSMGVMQTLMKSIRGLDSNVQEVQSNIQNGISTYNEPSMSSVESNKKLDTMINLLGQLIQVENMAVGTQSRQLKATKGLTGNMLRGV